VNQTGGTGDNSTAEPPIKGLTDLKFSTVFPIIALAGLSDGVNPCAFVILIFIVVFLQEISGSKKRIVRVTAAYIISFLIVNIIIGIIYYFISQKIGFPQIIRYIVITISIAAGLINIKDFFWYGKGISLGIPKSAKGYLTNLIHVASVPAALVLGASVAVLEAPCSIPIYLSVIEVLKGAGRPLVSVLPFILLYNLFFIVPLVALSVLVYKGHDAKIFEEKSLAAKKYMKLVIGIVLLLLALAFIKGWF
jgi:cytochrome c biogenesis protein CcdA